MAENVIFMGGFEKNRSFLEKKYEKLKFYLIIFKFDLKKFNFSLNPINI